MNDTPEKSVKPTIPSERVPDFYTLRHEFQSHPDFAVWQDLGQRTDKALRRSLFVTARTVVPTAREHRGTFKQACKPLHIKGDNIEGMVIRFLFGTSLDKHAVHDWSCVIKYWRECEPDQHDVQAASERTLTELKLAYRAKKRLLATVSPVATEAPERESLVEFVSASLSDFEPNIIIGRDIGHDAESDQVCVYLTREFPSEATHLYAVPLSDTGIRQCVRLIQSAEKNAATRHAIWADELRRVSETAE